VGRARKAHKAPETEQKVRTVERNGNSYEVNVAKIGRKPVQEEPEINTEVAELSETVTALHEENQRLKDAIALGQWDATDIEKVDAEQTIQELRDRITMLEADNRALRDSRDMYQSRNAELMATVKSLQSKLKKLEK
jgi:cell shape-determining protein MreC